MFYYCSKTSTLEDLVKWIEGGTSSIPKKESSLPRYIPTIELVKPDSQIMSTLSRIFTEESEYVRLICDKLGKNTEFLQILSTYYPQEYFWLMSKEIAKVIDAYYPDHIRDSKTLWSISAIYGEPIEIVADRSNLTKIELANAPFFRSKQEVIATCLILRDAKRRAFKRK